MSTSRLTLDVLDPQLVYSSSSSSRLVVEDIVRSPYGRVLWYRTTIEDIRTEGRDQQYKMIRDGSRGIQGKQKENHQPGELEPESCAMLQVHARYFQVQDSTCSGCACRC